MYFVPVATLIGFKIFLLVFPFGARRSIRPGIFPDYSILGVGRDLVPRC